MKTDWGDCINPLTNSQKEVWLTALRSGQYKQGYHQLYASGEYCCLGVLNEVCGLGFEGEKGGLENVCLPQNVQGRLITLNDESGKDFADIADFIEAEIHPLN